MSDFREIFRIIEDEKKKWMDEHKEEKIRAMVRDAFDATNINTILEICGFAQDTTWPKKGQAKTYWRIDHCNGRSGNSLIVDTIKKFIGPEIEKRFKGFDHLDEATVNQLKAEVRKAYIDQYRLVLRREATTLAEKHARDFIKSQIDNALSGDAEKIRLLMMENIG